MAVTRLFLLNGLSKRLRFDRDPRFVWSWSADSFPAPLVRFLHVLGVEPIICPPRQPWKKSYVERCVRTFKYEWLGRFSLNTMADCFEALEAFPDYHNHERLHIGHACGGRTPDEAFPNLPILSELPQTVAPNRWLNIEHGRVFRRRIRSNGTIQVDKNTYYVNHKLAKQSALVHLDGHNRCFKVSIDGKPLPKPLPIKDLSPDEMDLQDSQGASRRSHEYYSIPTNGLDAVGRSRLKPCSTHFHTSLSEIDTDFVGSVCLLI